MREALRSLSDLLCRQISPVPIRSWCDGLETICYCPKKSRIVNPVFPHKIIPGALSDLSLIQIEHPFSSVTFLFPETFFSVN